MAQVELQPMTEQKRKERDARLKRIYERNRRARVPAFVPKEVRHERDRNDSKH